MNERFDDVPAEVSGWSISVETGRSGFGDLRLLLIDAEYEGPEGVGEPVVLSSVVVLAPAERFREEEALPEDELFREIERLQEGAAR